MICNHDNESVTLDVGDCSASAGRVEDHLFDYAGGPL